MSPSAMSIRADGDVRACEYDLKKLDIEILLTNTHFSWAEKRSRYSDRPRAGRSGIESRWERDFPHFSRQFLGPTQPPAKWVLDFSGGKERPRRDADPSPLLVPSSRKSRAITLLPLWAVRPVQNPQYLYKGALYLTITYI